MNHFFALGLLLAMLCVPAFAAVPELMETRYCGAPQRDASGRIVRRGDVRAVFKRVHPCPATGIVGACPGWQIDHVIPLACGGCDAVFNLQWLPDHLKTVRGGKDSFERRVYCRTIVRYGR